MFNINIISTKYCIKYASQYGNIIKDYYCLVFSMTVLDIVYWSELPGYSYQILNHLVSRWIETFWTHV